MEMMQTTMRCLHTQQTQYFSSHITFMGLSVPEIRIIIGTDISTPCASVYTIAHRKMLIGSTFPIETPSPIAPCTLAPIFPQSNYSHPFVGTGDTGNPSEVLNLSLKVNYE